MARVVKTLKQGIFFHREHRPKRSRKYDRERPFTIIYKKKKEELKVKDLIL